MAQPLNSHPQHPSLAPLPKEQPALSGPGPERRTQVWPTLPPACCRGHQRTHQGRCRPRGARGPSEASPPPMFWDTAELEHPTSGAPGQLRSPSLRWPLQGDLEGIPDLLWEPNACRYPESTHTWLPVVPGARGAPGAGLVSPLGGPVPPGAGARGVPLLAGSPEAPFTCRVSTG